MVDLNRKMGPWETLARNLLAGLVAALIGLIAGLIVNHWRHR